MLMLHICPLKIIVIIIFQCRLMLSFFRVIIVIVILILIISSNMCLDNLFAFHSRRKLALSMMVIICLLISSLSLWPSPAPWITIAFNTLLVLFIPALLIQVLAAWKSESARRKCEVFQGGIQDFLTVANKSMDVAAKCVRFIQESELVARGFTL